MQKGTEKETNFWPYAILGMILTVVVLGIWTIRVAVKNPVQEADTYMMKYQEVDEKINEILAAQKRFENNFDVDLSKNRLKLGQNRIVVFVRSKSDGRAVADANVTALVTRPTTKEQDVPLGSLAFEEGRYVSGPFEIKRAGRWDLQVRVTIDGERGFFTYRMFVRPRDQKLIKD